MKPYVGYSLLFLTQRRSSHQTVNRHRFYVTSKILYIIHNYTRLMNKRYALYILYSTVGIIANLYVFQNDGTLALVVGSVLSIPILILTIEKFVRRFDFPLFFIRRDGLNYWGGAFGGFIALFGYIIGFAMLISFDILNAASFMFLIANFSFIAMILYTATILRDIEMGYIEPPQEQSG